MEEYLWAVKTNEDARKLEPQFVEFLDSNGFRFDHSRDLPNSTLGVFTTMSQHMAYDAGRAELGDVLTKKRGNCNALNQFLCATLERSGFVAVEENGIVMESGAVHMQSAVAPKLSTHMLTTDGVLFDNGLSRPADCFRSSMGPMLIFQRHLVFRWKDPLTGAKFSSLNPGGTAYLFDKAGKRIAKSGGVKKSYASKVVTDFEALQRELKAREGSR